MAITILVLQALTGERGASGGAAEQETGQRMSAAAQMRSPMRCRPNIE